VVLLFVDDDILDELVTTLLLSADVFVVLFIVNTISGTLIGSDQIGSKNKLSIAEMLQVYAGSL